MLKNYIRALRLPFITATILPFIFGSLIDRTDFNTIGFVFGLIAAAATHLGSNLINDYADSKAGTDWHDKRFFGLFSGSKLIQEGVLEEKFYLRQSILYFFIALIAVILLSFNLKNFLTVLYFLIILFLGFSYSHKPLQLAYHRLGELIIFLLFGPALVMGGYFIQTGIFPDKRSFLLSIPFGLLTSAILLANEVPDYNEDVKSKKYNLINLFRINRAHIIYYAVIILAFCSILYNLSRGYLNSCALFSLLLIIMPYQAGKIIRNNYLAKESLVKSSLITIKLHTLMSLLLILSLL